MHDDKLKAEANAANSWLRGREGVSETRRKSEDEYRKKPRASRDKRAALRRSELINKCG
jgi:hypothetical protein